MQITLAHVALLIVAGFVSGIINTLAGGGSFLTLAALTLSVFQSRRCQWR